MSYLGYFGRLISGVRAYYREINPATLTGAIDVIVVEQEDGTLLCSPFHVRFGKLGLLRSKEKVVDISINDEPVDVQMKLGDTGEAFFVEPVFDTDTDELPEHLCTSPLPDSPIKIAVKEPSPDQLAAKDELLLDELLLDVTQKELADMRSTSNQDLTELGKQKQSDFDAEVEASGAMRPIGLPVQKKNSDISPGRKTSVPPSPNDDVLLRSNDEDNAYYDSADEGRGRQSVDMRPRRRRMRHKVRDLDRKHRARRLAASMSALNKQTNMRKIDAVPANAETKVRRSTEARRPTEDQIFPLDLDDMEGLVSGHVDLGDAVVPSVEPVDIRRSVLQRPQQLYSSSVPTRAPISIDTFQSRNPVDSSSNSSLEDGGGSVTTVTVSDPKLERMRSAVSDTEITPLASPSGLSTKSESTAQDNSEMQQGEWNWGELPTPTSNPVAMKKAAEKEGTTTDTDDSANGGQGGQSGWLSALFGSRRSRKDDAEVEGVYLDDLVKDPEMAAKYLSSSLEERKKRYPSATGALPPKLPDEPSVASLSSFRSDPDISSVHAASDLSELTPLSRTDRDRGYGSQPDSIEERVSDVLSDVSLSLCGHPMDDETSIDTVEFDSHRVSFDQFNNDPNLIHNHKLVIKIGEKYYSWKVAAPVLLSMLVFKQPLTKESLASLTGRDLTVVDRPMETPTPTAEMNNPFVVGAPPPSPTGYYSSWLPWRRGGSIEPSALEPPGMHGRIAERKSTPEPGTATDPTQSPDTVSSAPNQRFFGEMDEHIYLSDAESESSGRYVRFKKSLRLSSNQLRGLNLLPGVNRARFSVTTKYQGTTWCTCDIYLFRYSDKLVISDIDGTITKSDVMGHIAAFVGGMWAQPGVTKLFHRIQHNGYRVIYLSARAIGQSYATKEYLRSVQLDGLGLPEGPVFLSPTSLLTAFHREVIEKKPEQFKKAVLNDLKSLFVGNENALYAGYGNRINDVWAYRAVGIPASRIFSINHLGELRYEFSRGFSSTYHRVADDLVDCVFPPLPPTPKSIGRRFHGCDTYSSFTYWKMPPPVLLDVTPPSDSEETTTDKKKKSVGE